MLKCRFCGDIFGSSQHGRGYRNEDGMVLYGCCVECDAELCYGIIPLPSYKSSPPYVRHGHLPCDVSRRVCDEYVGRITFTVNGRTYE